MTTMNLPKQSSLTSEAVNEISDALRRLLADIFSLYLKTKSFHWHMAGGIFATTICCSTSRPNRSSR